MRTRRLLLAVILLAPTMSARASDKTLLIELEQRSAALPGGVSASGAVVVGGLSTGGGFYWMPTTGVIATGGLAANKVSRDGRTIVGAAVGARMVQAAIWLRAAEWKLLGSFTPTAAPCDTSLSQALDTSSDGRVVVGLAWNGCTIAHAFRWEESTGMVDLGSSVMGRASLAIGVSADGKVVVGHQERADGFNQGARWVNGQQELMPGPDGFVGTANTSIIDGSIVAGRVCSPASVRPTDPNFQSAWVWTMRDGTQCLRPPALRASPGPLIIVEANAMSDDGRVIGGGQAVASSDDSNAVIWIDRVPFYLKDYLRTNGVPDAFATWVNTGSITGISADGRILVGKGAALSGFRGYIVILGARP